MSPGLPVRKDLPVREDCGYMRPGAASKSPFCYRPVTGSHLLGSAVCRVLGLWMLHLLFGLKPWTLVGDFRLSCDPCCGTLCSPGRPYLWGTKLARPRRPGTHYQEHSWDLI